MPQIADIAELVGAEMQTASPRATALVQDALQTVVEWKFATDEYYNPLPLYHEINKFKKGRILKDKVAPLAYQLGIHEFGFDAVGQLVVAQHVIGQNESLGVNVKLYTHGTGSIKHSTIRYYPAKNFPDKLIACGQYNNLSNEVAAEVVVGSNRSTSVTIFYTNESGLIYRIERQATGWNGVTTYTPIFDAQGVKEILVGDVRWWKRAGK